MLLDNPVAWANHGAVLAAGKVSKYFPRDTGYRTALQYCHAAKCFRRAVDILVRRGGETNINIARWRVRAHLCLDEAKKVAGPGDEITQPTQDERIAFGSQLLASLPW